MTTYMTRVLVCLAGLGLLALAASGCGGEEAAAIELPLEKRPALEVPAIPPPERLVIRELQEGSGQRAEKGDLVRIQYYGLDWHGLQHADSWNYSGIPEFTVGEHRLQRGLNRALIGMREGGAREVLIPYYLLHYPDEKHQRLIPSDALLYKLYLVDVQKQARAN